MLREIWCDLKIELSIFDTGIGAHLKIKRIVANSSFRVSRRLRCGCGYSWVSILCKMQQDSLEHVGYTIRIMWGTDLFDNYIGVGTAACKCCVRCWKWWNKADCLLERSESAYRRNGVMQSEVLDYMYQSLPWRLYEINARISTDQ